MQSHGSSEGPTGLSGLCQNMDCIKFSYFKWTEVIFLEHLTLIGLRPLKIYFKENKQNLCEKPENDPRQLFSFW